jgi:hypothetical protein
MEVFTPCIKGEAANMTIDPTVWQVAAWNFVVLAVASIGTVLVGVEPLIAG